MRWSEPNLVDACGGFGEMFLSSLKTHCLEVMQNCVLNFWQVCLQAIHGFMETDCYILGQDIIVLARWLAECTSLINHWCRMEFIDDLSLDSHSNATKYQFSEFLSSFREGLHCGIVLLIIHIDHKTVFCIVREIVFKLSLSHPFNYYEVICCLGVFIWICYLAILKLILHVEVISEQVLCPMFMLAWFIVYDSLNKKFSSNMNHALVLSSLWMGKGGFRVE